MKKNPFYGRQGDVMLIKLDALPGGLVKKEKDKERKRVTLAFGEKTGHAHAIYEPEKVEAYGHPENGPEELPQYLEVKEATMLKHDEHHAMPLEPGAYEVIIQEEWDEIALRARKVQD